MRILNKTLLLTVALMACMLRGSTITPNVAAGAGSKVRAITLNGLRFPIPKGYVQVPQTTIEDSVFLYDRKYNQGIVLTAPQRSFVETELLSQMTEAAIKDFFPKEQDSFKWKQFRNHRTISKFELGGFEEMGFNSKTLLIVHSHRFRVEQKDVFLLDIFKWSEGNAGEVFEGGLGAESMQSCNDKVDIIYAVTHEKIDDTNSPCELIAVP